MALLVVCYQCYPLPTDICLASQAVYSRNSGNCFLRFMRVLLWVRTRIYTVFLASVSFAKRHLCANTPNVAMLILVDMKASICSGTVHCRPVNASSAFYVLFMRQPGSTIALRQQHFRCVASSLPSHGFFTFYRFWINPANTFQQQK